MPNLNPNSTNYVHSHEPNTNDLVQAMTYDPYGAPVLRIDDTTKQHTSKNRVKTSDAEIIDYANFQHSTQGDVWDELTTGTADATHDPYLGMVKLEVGSDAGDEVVRQTFRVQPYIPGRQNEVSMAMIFGTPTTGVRRRFGLFDDNNGMYFEDAGDGTYYCVIRRNTAGGVVENRVARADWSEDKLDGTGPSGITADPLNIQFMSIEYEWSGHGQVEFKFIIDNNAYPIHKFNHGNRVAHTWASTPFLPVRVELTNVAGTAGTHTFYQGAHTVSSEGRLAKLGRSSSISTALTGVNLGNTANVFKPLVAIRLKAGYLDSVVMPKQFSGATLDNSGMFLRVIENPTITGGAWVDYNGVDSPVQYNITATGFTGGESIQTNYISPQAGGSVIEFLPDAITQLYRTTTTTLGDTSSTFLLAAASVGTNKSGWGSMKWITIR